MEGCCSTSIATLRLDDVHTVSSESLSTPYHVEQISTPADQLLPVAPQIPLADLVRPPGACVPTHLLNCSLLI